MANPGSPSREDLVGESESSVRALSPPPPGPPIVISDTVLSSGTSGDQYGFVGFDEDYPCQKFEAVGTAVGGFQFSAVGRGLHAHHQYFVGGHYRFFLSSLIPKFPCYGGSTVGVGCGQKVIIDRAVNVAHNEAFPESCTCSSFPPPPGFEFGGKIKVSTAERVAASVADAVSSRTRSKESAKARPHKEKGKRVKRG